MIWGLRVSNPNHLQFKNNAMIKGEKIIQTRGEIEIGLSPLVKMPFSNDWGDYLPNENNYLVYFINPNIHIW